MKRAALVLTVGLAAVALAACGGDGGGNGEGVRVDANRWTADVCDALLTWRRDIESRAADVQQQASGARDLDRLKTVFTRYLEDTVESSDRALREIDRAGTPAVDEGQAIKADVRGAFRDVREILDGARQDAENLPTRDAQAFAAGAERIATTIESRFEDVEQTFVRIDEDYDAPELDEAFADTPACQEFSATE